MTNLCVFYCPNKRIYSQTKQKYKTTFDFWTCYFFFLCFCKFACEKTESETHIITVPFACIDFVLFFFIFRKISNKNEIDEEKKANITIATILFSYSPCTASSTHTYSIDFHSQNYYANER